MNIINYFQRDKRFLKNINNAFIAIPFVLLPLLVEWWFHKNETLFFMQHKDEILFINIFYIILVRFALLDTAIYVFSRSKNTVHLALMQVVFLYLEITVVTK